MSYREDKAIVKRKMFIHFIFEQRPSQKRKLKGSPRAVSLPGPHAMQGSRKEEAIYTL